MFVRKFAPWNAPENVSGKRGPAPEKRSIPLIVKPYVPAGVVCYVRLVTFTACPAPVFTYSAPVMFWFPNIVPTMSWMLTI